MNAAQQALSDAERDDAKCAVCGVPLATDAEAVAHLIDELERERVKALTEALRAAAGQS